MELVWGVLILVLSVPCWAGQAVSWLAPGTAERWKLTESEATVEPAYYGDVRGEAVWDTFTLWTMPVAGVLLLAGSETWAYFGLAGGAMYLYFGGRGILSRTAIRRRGLRVGDPDAVRTAYIALAMWGLLGAAAVATGAAALAA